MDTDESFYGEHLTVLRLVEDSFLKRLKDLEQAFNNEKKRFPVEHYKSRIKSAGSARAKLERLGLPVTLESAKDNLCDLVGFRLVCRFFFEVYEAVSLLQEMEGVQVIRIKDYVKSPKSNGYRCVHLILGIPVQTGGVAAVQTVEVQIRTIAMDFWASLEHELKYKKYVPDAKMMSEELKRCANETISVDLKMQTIYEWLNQSRDTNRAGEAQWFSD